VENQELARKIKKIFKENVGIEPEIKTIYYYIIKIKNNDITLNMLPEVLNPKKTPMYHKALKEFDLNFFERRFFSSGGEDGIIDFIFSVFGTTNKFFVEFGVQNGTECNTRYLLEKKGWSGLMMDGGDLEEWKKGAVNMDGGDHLKSYIKTEFVTAENINELFKKYNVPQHFDLLSVDIDLNDYWVWKAIDNYHPRVVVIEYNSSIPPTESKVVPYDPLGKWDRTTNYFGASLLALYKLGLSKGYTLIGCSQSGLNAFFVKKELLPKQFQIKSVEDVYRPPQYGIKKDDVFIGHPPSDKKMVEI